VKLFELIDTTAIIVIVAGVVFFILYLAVWSAGRGEE
jgi:hypothetical protein